MKRTFLLTALAAAGTLAAQDSPRPIRPVVTSPAFSMFRTLDTDGSRSISEKEWSLLLKSAEFGKADQDKDGQVNAFEWRNFIRPSGGRPDGGGRPGGGGGPAVGQPAPNLKLKALKDNRLVDLVKVKRHTVLVFGSYT